MQEQEFYNEIKTLIESKEINSKVRYLKENNHNKAIGLLIVKKKDKYVIEYATESNIYITKYELTE